MALITRLAQAKGQKNEWTLVKADLSALISDPYLADSEKWEKVTLYMQSSEGSQRRTLIFNCDGVVTPKANFSVSDQARDSWQVQKIVVEDKDGDEIEILRANLPVADIDVTFAGGGGGASYSLLTESTYGSFYATAPLSLAGIQGQTFQFSTPASGQLGKVRILMMRQGNSDAVIGMRIRNAANAIQTISSTTINHDDVTLNMNGDSAQEIEFLFDNEVFNMASSTTYKFELYCVSGTQNPVMYLRGASSTYSGGNRYDENQAWNEDLFFAVFEKL
jgi:hypothetical protein